MDYVLNIIPQMMDGCLVSFQVFIITIVLSIPLGILLSLGRVSGIKPLQALIGGYVWILRGSPLMLQMFQFTGLSSRRMARHDSCRVAPFGDVWIIACLRLPIPFRSLPRPSSTLNA